MKRSGQILALWIFGLGTLILSACSNNGIHASSANSILNQAPGNSPICQTSIDPTSQSYINAFPMLNAQGQPGPAVNSAMSGYPLGALINFASDGSISYCTVAHMGTGNVLTAAHCVENDSNPADYFIIYYGKNGQRSQTRVYTWWKGSSDNVDAAVLRICPDGYNNWDTAGTDLYASTGINTFPPKAFNVAVWAYDPIKNYPNIYNYYGSHAGMLFPGPKTFAASRTIPQAYGYDTSGNNTGSITSNKVNANIHLMMDNGAIPLVSGNSGSLITLAGNFDGKVGVYHWGIGPNNPTSYSAFWYLGNSGVAQWLSPNATTQYYSIQLDLEFFQVGSVFDAFSN